MPRAPIALVVALAALLGSPVPALGKKPEKHDHKHHHKHGHKHGSHGPASVVDVDVNVNVVFASAQRDAVRGWIVEDRGRGHCPPGLAKKHNGCLPPGQAKKRYRVGHRCPEGVVVSSLPPVLEVRLGPPPSGYRYGILDGDIVKFAVGTMLIVDAIDGLVD
jgi:hypothetical protein